MGSDLANNRKIQLRRLVDDALEKLGLEPRDIRTGDYNPVLGIEIEPHHIGRGASTAKYYVIRITAAEPDPAGHLRALPGGRRANLAAILEEEGLLNR